jgi:enterobactin synthetase component D
VARLSTRFGTCEALELAAVDVDRALAALPAIEQALAAAIAPARRAEWIAGRTALRALLVDHAPELAGHPLTSDDRGAPVLPAGWVGSISHKHPRGEAIGVTRAVAIVAAASEGFVGVDLERTEPSRIDIARRILTERERARGDGDDGSQVMLRFAIKEAIYKAIDPIVRRYVGFTEVELTVAADGSCGAVAVDPARLPVVIEAGWQTHAGHWLATARARPR